MKEVKGAPMPVDSDSDEGMCVCVLAWNPACPISLRASLLRRKVTVGLLSCANCRVSALMSRRVRFRLFLIA